MVEPFTDLDPLAIRGRLDAIRAVAGADVDILVATKYVPVDSMGVLAEAGIGLVGENRADSLVAKHARWGGEFRWDFIGSLQSRKVKQVAPLVGRIHSLASGSAMARLAACAGPAPEVFIQVNLSGEPGKSGIEAEMLPGMLEQCPVPVAGLMTMPPATANPESSRPHFARLAELAARHGLAGLSMGTSQDWKVAVEEGATVIRLGHSLLAGGSRK